MDITSIGAQFINPMDNPFSSVGGSRQASDGAGFEEYLRRLNNTYSPSTASGNAQLPSVVRNVELYEACLELETILINNLIKGMRNTIQKSGLLDSSFAGEVYEDMLYDEYARSFTRSAQLGFAEMAHRELTGQR